MDKYIFIDTIILLQHNWIQKNILLNLHGQEGDSENEETPCTGFHSGSDT